MRRSAEGRIERFGAIVAELVGFDVDVIVTIGDVMTQRAREVTSSVPIVMTATFDPIGAGLVKASRGRAGTSPG